MDFLIGGIGGVVATFVTHPLDLVKTRMQLEGELRARTEYRAQYHGLIHAMSVIARTEGIRSLMKGVVPAILLGFQLNSVRLGLFHIAEDKGWTKNKYGDVSLLKAGFHAGVDGSLGAIVANPMTVIKTRLQAAGHPSIAVGKQYKYTGLMDAISKIYKVDGLRGFFAGVKVACVRLGVGSAAQLTSFSLAKETLLSLGILKDSVFVLSFVASLFGGIAVALTACPLDVVAVRMYNQGTSGYKVYGGLLDGLRKIYASEGLHGLYKGIGPLYYRMAPQTTICLVIWDLLNNKILPNKKSCT